MGWRIYRSRKSKLTISLGLQRPVTRLYLKTIQGASLKLKAQVEAGNVTWDIIDVEKSDAVRGCDEGLFMEIDPTFLPAGSDGTAAVDDFIPGSFTDCAVANIVWSTILLMIHL